MAKLVGRRATGELTPQGLNAAKAEILSGSRSFASERNEIPRYGASVRMPPGDGSGFTDERTTTSAPTED